LFLFYFNFKFPLYITISSSLNKSYIILILKVIKRDLKLFI
ncbi:hypothetical protein CCHL11_10199, partial [Colletotrichum chlorophyti]